MIEVEAKIAISANEVDDIRKRAGKIGKFKGKIKKVDDYFTLEPGGRYPRKSLRIRKADGYRIINFKERISLKSGIHAKKETEFKVSDIKGFLALINDFGFRKWLRKEKETESYEIKKDFNIEINKLKHLGWFLEIEHLVDNKNKVGDARKEILEIINKLGLRGRKIVKEGYTKMLWDKGFAG